MTAASTTPTVAAPGSAIPFKPAGSDIADDGIRGLIVLIVVLAVAYAALMWLRRRFPLKANGQASGGLTIRQRTRVGPKSWLVVAEFGGQTHLLSIGDSHATTLASAPAGLPASAVRPGVAPSPTASDRDV